MTQTVTVRGRSVDVARAFDIAFVLACLGAWAGMMYLSSGLTFFADEWDIVKRGDDWSLDYLMAPHNEHWMIGFKLVYKPLLAIVGLTSYAPYMAVALALHVAAAAALYVYARRQIGPIIALAIGVVFLLLGSAGEDLLMGMQINFNGSTAAGAWALVILMREPAPRYAWLAAILLLVSVTFSGIGLFFVAGAAAIVVVAPHLRRCWWVLLPAVVSYGTWYLVYGREAHRTVSRIPELIEFTRVGIANAVAQLTGLGLEVGLIIAVLLAIAAIAELAGGKIVRLGLIAGSVGLLAQFVVTGLARADGGAALSTAPRYIHPAVALILIAIIGWLGHRDLKERRSLGLMVAVGGLAALALAWNLNWARSQLDLFRDRANETRAAITLLTRYGGAPAFPADRGVVTFDGTGRLAFAPPGHPGTIPGADGLVPLLERWGDPLRDPLAVRSTEVPDVVFDRVFGRLMGDALIASPAEMPMEPSPLDVRSVLNATTEADGACLRLHPSGPSSAVVLAAPSGASLHIQSEDEGTAEVAVSLRGTFTEGGSGFEVGPAAATRISVPDIGSGEVMQVRVGASGDTVTRLCMSGGELTPGLDPGPGLSGLTVRQAASESFAPAAQAPAVELSHSVRVGGGPAGCVVVTPVGQDPYLSFLVPDGQALLVTATEGGAAQVFVDVGRGFNEADSVRLELTTDAQLIHMPPGSDPNGWSIRLDPPDDGATTVCSMMAAATESAPH